MDDLLDVVEEEEEVVMDDLLVDHTLSIFYFFSLGDFGFLLFWLVSTCVGGFLFSLCSFTILNIGWLLRLARCGANDLSEELVHVFDVLLPLSLLFFRVDGWLERCLRHEVGLFTLGFRLLNLFLFLSSRVCVTSIFVGLVLCGAVLGVLARLGRFLRSLRLLEAFNSCGDEFLFDLFLYLDDMGWVVSLRVPIVHAYFKLLVLSTSLHTILFRLNGWLLFHVVKENKLYVLLRYCLTNKPDSNLFVWPVLASQIVKDGTCVAVFFLEALLKHAKQQILW